MAKQGEVDLTWNKIAKGDLRHGPETGLYLVAFFHELQNAVEVGIGSCIDGHWRIPVFETPIAWMPLPEPPTLESLGLVEWAKEKVAEHVEEP